MKRVVSLMLVVLMIAAIFVGCGSSGSSGDVGNPEGLYKIKSVNGKSVKEYFKSETGVTNDSDIDLALAYLGIDSLDNLITFELRSGGKLVASMMGQSVEGTWKLNGNKVIMTVDGESSEATFKNGELIVENDGQKMVLAR